VATRHAHKVPLDNRTSISDTPLEAKWCPFYLLDALARCNVLGEQCVVD
jgi:hypothetical protein